MDKKKILVVAGDLKFCEKFKSDLEKEGHEVQCETKAEQAYATVQTFKPNLVFVDISESDFGGTNAAYKIQQDEKLKKVTLAYPSAFANKNDTEMFAGLVDGGPFIAKPIFPRGMKPKDILKKMDETPSQ